MRKGLGPYRVGARRGPYKEEWSIADVTRSLGTDYYLIDELLTDEEREVRDKVRAFADPRSSPS